LRDGQEQFDLALFKVVICPVVAQFVAIDKTPIDSLLALLENNGILQAGHWLVL
jgi:hypothetical protein